MDMTLAAPVATAANAVHLGLRLIHHLRGSRLCHHEAYRPGKLVAKNLALAGREGNEYRIILVAAIQALPFWCKYPAHKKWAVLDAYGLPRGVFIAKQVFCGNLAENDDPRS